MNIQVTGSDSDRKTTKMPSTVICISQLKKTVGAAVSHEEGNDLVYALHIGPLVALDIVGVCPKHCFRDMDLAFRVLNPSRVDASNAARGIFSGYPYPGPQIEYNAQWPAPVEGMYSMMTLRLSVDVIDGTNVQCKKLSPKHPSTVHKSPSAVGSGRS